MIRNNNLIVMKLISAVFLIVCGFVNAGAQVNPAQRAQELATAGLAHFKQQTPESYRLAITELQQSVQFYQQAKMPVDAAETMYLLGLTTGRVDGEKAALKIFEEIETAVGKIVTEIPADAPDAPQTYSRLMNLLAATEIQNGLLYAALGDQEKSVERLTDALSFYRESGAGVQETETLKTIGDVYNNFGEKIKAIEYFKQALDAAKKTGDKAGQSFLLNYLGKNYNDLQENARAAEYFLEALPLRRELKDRLGEGQTLANLGRVYSDTAEYQKALQYLLLALPIRREVGDRSGEAITLNNLGIVYLSLGENQKALEYFTLSAPIFKEKNDLSGEATALSNVGLIYSELGDNQTALDYFNRVLLVRRANSDAAGEATALNNLGNIYSQKGEFRKALDFFKQSKTISEKINDRKGEAVAALNIGTLFAGAGKSAKDGGQLRAAVSEFHNALILTKAVGDQSSEADALEKLMDAYDALQFVEKPGEADFRRTAILYGKMAVNKYQQLRRNTDRLDPNTQKVYLKKIENAYRSLAGKLMRSERLPEAQQVLNAFKDQQFFDFDKTRLKAVAPLTLTPREKIFIAAFAESGAKIGVLGEQLLELEKGMTGGGLTAAEKSRKARLETDFTKTVVLFGTLLGNGELDFGNAPTAADRVGQMPETTEMQSVLRDLTAGSGQPTVAVYQLADQENFNLLLITAETISTVSAPFKKETLDEQALKFWGLLQSPDYDPTKLGKQLYDEIFQPLEKILPPETKTIVWSLDGNLRYIPVAALFDGKNYLVERYNNVIFTRADRERMTRAVSPVWTGTGLGSSKAQTVALAGENLNFAALPGVSEELGGIFKTANAPGGVIGGEVLPDEKFTRRAMFAALKQKRPLVHIASHFSFRPGDESRSFLLLGDGSALTLDEIRAETNLFAGVELLTLSACNTAAQRADAGGREIDGFAELAQRLGAGSVMATLWSVADGSTPLLMKDFYAARQNKTGTTKAEALRRAQLILLRGAAQSGVSPNAPKSVPLNQPRIVVVAKNGKRDREAARSDVVYLDESDAPPFAKDEKKPFAHPYYWSPFVLIGNWK